MGGGKEGLSLEIFGTVVSGGTLALLALCLAIALGFEFVNGFHDTANAVATVIYTKSLKPGVAVVWSGIMNFFGVFFGTTVGGAAVAFGIVHLLPVDLLIQMGQSVGLLMVLSLLLSAIIWNLGTWYFGLPSSSSHALIGSILGVGVASSLLSGNGLGSGVNWAQAQKVGLSLLASPLFGFGVAAALLLLCKALIKDRRLYDEPKGDAPPPLWIRSLLFLTCTLVSFFHGSNDGQKGVGLIMLILIGILPAQFAVSDQINPAQMQETLAAVRRLEAKIAPASAETAQTLAGIASTLASTEGVSALSSGQRTEVRAAVLRADSALGKFEKENPGAFGSPDEQSAFKKDRKALNRLTDFVAGWVPFAVALALGIGTMVGWKRIVVTVGEKIGKTHLTYAQGAAAEIVAAATIYAADHLGLPVSTTHVLSSGIAGTMAANRSGLQGATIRNIALAWVLTLPVTMLLAGSLFALTAGGAIRKQASQATLILEPRLDRTKPLGN
ncbi:MAG: inorganic phosphate transporter [Cytophagales bacterium]|nr:inorganic phosphate transporter [Armatimonadota bacterium]